MSDEVDVQEELYEVIQDIRSHLELTPQQRAALNAKLQTVITVLSRTADRNSLDNIEQQRAFLLRSLLSEDE